MTVQTSTCSFILCSLFKGPPVTYREFRMKVFFRVLALIVVLISVLPIPAKATSSSLVISQLYLGTGEGNTVPRNQYIELFNLGTTTVSLQGWSLQYAQETANAWTPYPLSGSIAPGQYYLIRAGSTGGTAALPQPDFTINLSLPLSVGKLALTNDSIALDTGCPSTDTAKVIDRLGWGTSSCFEGSRLVQPDVLDLQAHLRKAGGCTESDNNFQDFVRVTPLPRNTSSAGNLCRGSSGTRTFSLPQAGSTSFQSIGGAAAISVGYARVQTDSGGAAPAGVAIFGFRQGGTLISETGVAVSPLVTSGLTYIDIGGAVNTGMAIANPNSEDVTVTYTITDSNNVQFFVDGSVTIAANTQLARFFNELPYLVRALSGTFAFTSTAPIAITTLRGFTNERGEFLVSTLPLVDISVEASTLPSYLPHFAVGGGWRTELVLVNTVDTDASGTIAFFDQSGSAMTVPVGTVTTSTIDYVVPARRTIKFTMQSTGSTIQVGSAKVTPITGSRAPLPLGVFSYSTGGVRVSEASVLGVRGTLLRTYIENSGTAGSNGAIQSGLAISNADVTTATVNLEVFRLDGTSTGLTSSLIIPVGGKVAKFSNELFPSLPSTFKGTLKLTASSPVSVIGLRGRTNERADFLITTVPLTPELSQASSSEVVFPHLVDGGGYTTQFVLFNVVNGFTSSGNVLLRTIGGRLLDLNLQ